MGRKISTNTKLDKFIHYCESLMLYEAWLVGVTILLVIILNFMVHSDMVKVDGQYLVSDGFINLSDLMYNFVVEINPVTSIIIGTLEILNYTMINKISEKAIEARLSGSDADNNYNIIKQGYMLKVKWITLVMIMISAFILMHRTNPIGYIAIDLIMLSTYIIKLYLLDKSKNKD